MTLPANSKRVGGYCSGRARHSVRADFWISNGGRGLPALPIHSLEFKNNFATAFALGRVRDGGFDFV
jgi:hypothetical protein